MNSLSAIIITKNEAKNIVNCLESLKFVNEIIILDSGSTDETVALAKQYTPHIYEVDWPGFGIQKNRALEKCSHDWVISIDADEILSDELEAEIKQLFLSSPKHDAYTIPRKSTYCNKRMLYGDWRNDHCVRLFNKGRAKFIELPVHEKLIVNGTVGKLKGVLYHNAILNLEEVLHKTNYYSTLGAEFKFQQGKRAGLLTAILRGCWTFFRGYILKLGFLDGKKGFMLAVSNAEGCYYKYLKIMLLAEENKKTSI